ncbi:MAG: DNA polymerase IV [Acidobacteria bacterium]|nr:MAG: DNA polymerase IV [Acidobacteriota bacterium]
MEHERLIMHLDMDAFFAAIEQRDHPEYMGLPVIVGAEPGTRGVVSTCSYEARAFGVKSAMPISEAYRRCPKAIYLRPDMARYLTVSRQVMEILATISPVVEPVSVDEAFLDITGLERLFGLPDQIGLLAKRKISLQLRLTASVGIGPNRLIAKLASDYRKPDGLTVVPPEQVQSFLDPLPVSKLSGVGKVLEKKCHEAGIETIRDLRFFGLSELQKQFGEKTGSSLHERSHGIASAEIGLSEARKSVSREVTFNEDTSNIQILHDTLLHLSSDVGRLARSEGLAGRVVHVKIRLKGFETHTRQCRIEKATQSDREIFHIGWGLFEKSGYAGSPIRLIGVGLSDLEAPAGSASSLFDSQAAEKEKRLFAAVDLIKRRHGTRSIHLGHRTEDDEDSDR